MSIVFVDMNDHKEIEFKYPRNTPIEHDLPCESICSAIGLSTSLGGRLNEDLKSGHPGFCEEAGVLILR
eukprot:scaffold517_cov119-Cylindrotheca_fusiformis.AAC.7